MDSDSDGSSEIQVHDSERSEVTWPELLRKTEPGWLPCPMLVMVFLRHALLTTSPSASGSHFPLATLGKHEQSCDGCLSALWPLESMLSVGVRQQGQKLLSPIPTRGVSTHSTGGKHIGCFL